jgi:hypothetical protein
MNYYPKRRPPAKIRRIIEHLSRRQQPTDWDAVYLMSWIRCEVNNDSGWFMYEQEILPTEK